jgi:hypothetical protein
MSENVLAGALFLLLQFLVISMIMGWFPVQLMVTLRRRIRLFPGRLQVNEEKETRRFRTLGFVFLALEGFAILWTLLSLASDR